MTVETFGSDEPFLAQVSQIARPGFGRAIVVVAEVACRDDPKRANGRERAAFRAPERVRPFARVVNDLSVTSSWQVEVTREDVPRIDACVTVARVAIALRPS